MYSENVGVHGGTIGAGDDTFRNGVCRECEYVCLHSTRHGLSWAKTSLAAIDFSLVTSRTGVWPLACLGFTNDWGFAEPRTEEIRQSARLRNGSGQP